MDDWGKQVGDRLRVLREKHNMTQQDLADAMEERGVRIARSYISEVERQGRIPSGAFMVEAARLYGVSTDNIYGLDEPEDERRWALEAERSAEMINGFSPETRLYALRLITNLRELDQELVDMRRSHDSLALALFQLIQNQASVETQVEATDLVRRAGYQFEGGRTFAVWPRQLATR